MDYKIEDGWVVFPNGERRRAISGGNTSTSTQTQARNIAPPTPQEQALIASNTALGGAQSQDLMTALANSGAFATNPDYLAQLGLGRTSVQNLQALATGGAGYIPPQLQQIVQQAYAGPAAQARAQLLADANNSAAARGMAISDSPVAAPYLQQSNLLEQNLASQEAQAELGGLSNWQNFNTGLNSFAEQLRQQQTSNALNLGTAQSPNYAMQQNLAGLRIQSAPVTTQGSATQPFGQTFGQIAGGVGNLGFGLFGRAGAWPTIAGGIKDAISSPSGSTGGSNVWKGIFSGGASSDPAQQPSVFGIPGTSYGQPQTVAPNTASNYYMGVQPDTAYSTNVPYTAPPASSGNDDWNFDSL